MQQGNLPDEMKAPACIDCTSYLEQRNVCLLNLPITKERCESFEQCKIKEAIRKIGDAAEEVEKMLHQGDGDGVLKMDLGTIPMDRAIALSRQGA